MIPARAKLLPFCLILTSAFPVAAAHTIESTFAADAIIIDGTTEDWGDRPVIYLEDSEMRFKAASKVVDGVFGYELRVPLDEKRPADPSQSIA